MVPDADAVGSGIGDRTSTYVKHTTSSEGVIDMFNTPAITWILTIVLLLSGGYQILQATRSRQLTEQVNQSLHALMHVLMAAMLWHLGSSMMLVQIAVLTGAAWWFILQAVARPELKTLCAGSHGRLKCVYHSLTMAGAALMIAMMGQVTTSGYKTAPQDAMAMSHDHHAMAAPVPNTTAATLGHSPELAILLTVFFGAAAVVFIVLLLRSRTTKTTHHKHPAPKLSVRLEHGLEALAATIMALMFATMTA